MTKVNFYLPPMGLIHTPMGIDGEGEVEATPEGLKLTGARKWRSGGGVAGFGFFVGAIAGGVAAGFVGAVVGCIAGAVGLYALGRKLSPPKTDPVVIPWDRVASLELDGPHASFVSRGKPAGQVWFFPQDVTPSLPPGTAAAPPNAVALRKAANLTLISELRAVGEATGAKISGRR